jgi:tol-pal system protein YbgF
MSSPASAARYIPNLEGRIQSLEESVDKLQERSGRQGGSQTLASLRVELEALKEELRTLRGSVEENQHAIRTLQREVQMINEDTGYRLQQLEEQARAQDMEESDDAAAPDRENGAESQPGTADDLARQAADMAAEHTMSDANRAPLSTLDERYLSVPPDKQQLDGQGQLKQETPDTGDTSAAPDTASRPPQGSGLQFASPREHYNYALGKVRADEFETARESLMRFIAEYPGHRLTGNAYYWLGETYYVQEKFIQAADMFRQGFETDTAGIKAPDNLYKLAKSLLQLDKKQEACVVFGQIRERYRETHPEVAGMAFDAIRAENCKN